MSVCKNIQAYIICFQSAPLCFRMDPAAPATGSMKQRPPFRLYRIGSAYSAAWQQGLRRKRKHNEVDVGLFVEHAQTYMRSNSIRVQWTPPPDEYIPLSGGDSSNTFLSRDGTVVYKFYLKQKLFQHTVVRPNYVPSLGSLTTPRSADPPAHLLFFEVNHKP
jgi:hypothetical protein